MKTIVRVEQYDSSNKPMDRLTMIEQMEVNELVELFLAADLKKKEQVLNKLRK